MQKTIKSFSINIHSSEYYSLVTEIHCFVSKPTVMKLFPASFCFNSAILFIADVSRIPLHMQLVMVDYGNACESLLELLFLELLFLDF